MAVMNLLDFVIIALLLFSLIRGVFRGLIKELSSIVGVLGGFYAAYTYYPVAAKQISSWMSHPTYANIVGFMAIFIAVCIVVAIAASLIKYLMKLTFLGWADRLGGALVGTVKGAIVALVIVMMLTAFLPNNASVLRDSMAARHLLRVCEPLVAVVSKEMKTLIIPKIKELNQTWNKKM
jgi:membrane protein required for colicin V production